MLRRCGTALLLLVSAPALLSAQYFGQNKVQYQSFDFKIIETEHFDVYFYERERVAAMDAARIAERSYARLSRILSHQFRERKTIILYASHSDFQQTNTTPGDVGEGTGGFTDFFKQRNVMPLTGSYADIEHVLTHEMVHQFQFDIYSGGRAGGGLATLIAVAPPLWFAEGMAEYLSIGPEDPNTAMWLRDAALEGKLPTIEQLTGDPRIFPYRFGQALFSYIGERWGDEAIGGILLATRSAGLEGGFRRTLGLSLEELSNQWRDAVYQKYLPDIGERVKARAVATELLTEKKSDGTLHLAPALSPDGSQIAYFSEKDFFFVDLYLADGETGHVKRRLLKSTVSSNYETFRFINSQASWSPDGKYLAVAAKRGPRDDIVIIDVRRNKRIRSIRVDLNGVTTPSWSPDGEQLVFTGYDGGLSDLFVVNRDGTGLRRLTQDKYADFHPVWSPDGKTIAFATDRSPKTDFSTLSIGNFRIAIYDIATGEIRSLGGMERGKNISPAWAPDGGSFAFVSDRTGVSNIFLYDLRDDKTYQLTDFYTGAQGITPLSPVLSWAHDADRLAFVYYERGHYDVYTLADPRSLQRHPYDPASDSAAAVAQRAGETAVLPGGGLATGPEEPTSPQVGEGRSMYRTARGFRPADDLGGAGDTTRAPAPLSLAALLDSTTTGLPNTDEFSVRPYSVKFSPDFVARPSIGYTRDNFGRGFSGSSAIALSDMLGDHNLLFAAALNGRLSEAQFLAAYSNLARRINWAAGISQEPHFFLEAPETQIGTPTVSENTLIYNIRRLVIRSAFGQASYPLSRFQRVEAGVQLSNVDDALLSIRQAYDPATSSGTRDAFLVTENRPGANFVQPSAALVFDNTLFGYVGPFFGKRYRFEIAQSVGTWRFTQATADYRRYDGIAGPVVLATRALYFGRVGRDADEFRIFGGRTELIRGNTSGSYLRNECRNASDGGTESGCVELDRLIGTQIGVATTELRFPLLDPSFGFLPAGFPPIEGALFYDVGLIWDGRSAVKWHRSAGDDPIRVRTPLTTLGFSVRTNILGFVVARLDYSIPQHRAGVGGLWTLSFGPAF